MRMRKRALSLFVTFAMCFSILPSSVWAVEAGNGQEESAPVSADAVVSAEAAVEDAPALPEDNAPTEAADVPAEEGATPAGDDDTPPSEDAGVLPQEDAALDEAFEEPAQQNAGASQSRAAFVDDVPPVAEEAAPEKGKGAPEDPEEPGAEKSLDVAEAGSYAPDGGQKDTTLLTENELQEVLETGSSNQVLWSDSTDLEAGWTVVYSYTPTTSGTYTFESTNASGDAVGWLTVMENGSERELVRNDDGGRANGNSRNFSFSYNLTEGTTYRFHAKWYSSSASGTMVCQLSRSANAQAITADGSTHTVRLTEPGQYAYFSFVPPSSGTYVFESVNTSGDPYGYLYCVTNENGNEMWQVLASNDDGGDGLNCRISYVFTAGVTYYFGVRFWGSSATGEITVQLTGENPRDKVLTPLTASNPVVENDEEITTLGERKYFQFTPTVSGTYVFESTNTSNDPVGELYESDRSTRITSNDDGGNGRNFRLVYDLIAGTTYYYAVRFFGSSTIGRIDVRLTLELDDIIIPIVLNASEVALKGYTTASVSVPGTTANSAVSTGVGYFSFTPTVSGTYVYESTNSSGDTVGALYDSVGGTQLASNDDGGTGSNFRLSYSLTAGTTYIYTARWYSSSSSGDISVRVRRDWSELATVMQAGSTETARIRQRGQVVYFAFTPSTTQDYSFESSNNVSDDSSIFDPLVTLYDADFNSLQSNDDGGEGRNFYITSTLTAGTTYYYGVKRYGDSSTGSATVRLSGAVPASNTTTIDAAAVERDGSWNGSANITTPGEYAYFDFTPRSSGTYIFESTNSDGDPHGHFYENGLGSTSTADNDDGGNGLNFRLVQTLEAGRTYGFAARWHWSSSTGTIYVRMTKEASDDVISLDAAAVEQNNFTTATATISTGGRVAYFSFTPQSSGSYIFESTNTSGDTYGYFYDTQSPDDNTTPADRNDDGGNGLNFRLTKTLTAGTTYYYGAKFYSSSTTGNIEVKMSKGNAVVNPTGVTVELASSSIYVGNNTTATARVTPDNATDKSVTWSSSNTSVATIVGGRITGVAEGTATITARTVNDITGSATITVEPTPPTRHEFHTDFEYDFLNSGSSFGYGPNYKIPQVRFEQVGYTPRQAASIYNASSRETKNAYWGGSCFGFSSSSVLFYKDILQEENYDPNVHVPHGFRAPSGNSAYDVKLRSMIELMQLSQPFWNETYSAPRQDFNPQRIAAELDNDNPVVLSIGLIYNLRAGGHAVVIYGYDRDSSGNYTFYIYDNSTFVESVTCSSSGRYVRNSNDFRFQVSSRMRNSVSQVWPTGFYTLESIRTIYDTLKRENHSGAANLLDVNDQRYVYIFCPVGDATIQNSAGDTAVIRDSELSGDDLNLELILPTFSMDEDENSTETRYYTIVAPEDTYRITPAEGNLTVVGVDMSVDVSTDATPDTSAEAEPLITISSDLCTVSLDTEDGNNYYVNYYVYNSRFDTLSVSGTAAEYVSASLKADLNRVDVEGARNITAEAIVGGKSSRVQGSAGFGQDSLPFSVTWSAPEEGESDLRIDQNLNSESLNFSALVEDEDLNDVSKMPMGGPVDDDWESTTLNAREQLNPPTFSEPRINADNSLEVDILSDEGTVIYYYITDESDEATANPMEVETRQPYTAPILIAPNMQIVAVATKFGYPNSEVAKWKYREAAAELIMYYGDLDGDGEVTILEIMDIIAAKINGSISPVMLRMVDLDGDGELTILEIMDMIAAKINGSNIERRG